MHAGNLLVSLTTYDFNDPLIQLQFVLASFFIWLSICLSSYALSFMLSDTFHQLKSKEKIFWNLTLVRAVFGVVGPYLGVWVIFYAKDLDSDVINGVNPMSNAVILISLGFFLFEALSVTISDIIYGRYQILLNIHHWLAVADFVTAFYSGQCHFFACTVLLLEMSTPFSAVCWTLIKCGYANSYIWKVNQFFLLHSFHMRSIIEFYMCYKAYMSLDSLMKMTPGCILLIFGSLLLSTFVMTPYWTYKKTVQFCSGTDFNFEAAERPQSNGTVINKKKE